MTKRLLRKCILPVPLVTRWVVEKNPDFIFQNFSGQKLTALLQFKMFTGKESVHSGSRNIKKLKIEILISNFSRKIYMCSIFQELERLVLRIMGQLCFRFALWR